MAAYYRRTAVRLQHATRRFATSYSRQRSGPAPARRAMANLNNGIIDFYIKNVYTTVVIVLGTIGNIISISVFASKLRVQSTSLYFWALAVSDTMYLSLLPMSWVRYLLHNWITLQEKTSWSLCQTFVFMSRTMYCLSAWLLVVITVEQFVAILYPLRGVNFTPNRVRFVICGLTILSILLNGPWLWVTVSENELCGTGRDYEKYEKDLLINTLWVSLVPFFVILVLNTSIVVMVYRRTKEREMMTRSQLEPREFADAVVDNSASSQQHITRMLLIVSSVYVVLNLPSVITIISYAGMSYEERMNRMADHWAATQEIAFMLCNTNFGIKFFLYCLSGQNFRRALRETLSCGAGRAAVVQPPGTDE